MSKKTWDDNLLFYGGEALVLLVAEGYIVYHTYEGPSTLPFCLGLMITALVAGIGMHWGLTKKSTALKSSGYFVWLAITLIVCITAGVLWTANDRLKQHTRSLSEAEALRRVDAKLHIETKKADTETELTAKLATVRGFSDLLDKAKTPSERAKIIKLGKEMITPTATPEPIEAQVAAVMKPSPVAVVAATEWRPFPPGTVFNWIYEDLVRFCAVIGIAGLGLLLGVFILKRDEEAALQIASRGSLTQHVVTTSGPQHESQVNSVGQPRVVMGYAPPVNPDPNSTTNRP